MKFGLIMVPQVRAGDPEPWEKLVEQVEFAEELGYDSIWLTEHHFSEYGRPGVPAQAGYLGGRTKRITIGTAVVVLPFHHPIRVAEDWAVLDHLLEGRLEVGFGRGSQPAEFAGFDVSMNEARERYNESLEIIKKAWTEETFSYDGEFWKIPELSVLPKPYTQPHPRLWAAAVSAPSVKMIVNHGINGLIGPYLCPFDVLQKEFFGVWHDATAEAGRTDLQICHNEFVYVGETEEQVKRDVEEDVMWYIRKAAKLWGERDRSKVADQYKMYNDVLDYFDEVPFDEVYRDLTIFGTPDIVAEKITRFRDEAKVDYLMNFMWFGGLEHEKAMRNMELFATEVMPRFKEQPAAAEPVAVSG